MIEIDPMLEQKRAEALAAYKKDVLTLRYWLLAKGFHMALRAMKLGASYHTGYRKDGFTPEFHHQVRIALLIRTLPDLLFREETIALAFTHDLCEDFNLHPDMIRTSLSRRVGDATWTMTKVWNGVVRSEDEIFAAMANDALASIAKPVDRDQNMSSMRGVFLPGKRVSYTDFAEARILPLIKEGSRNFTEQEPAYEILKYLIEERILYEREIATLSGVENVSQN